MIDADFLQVPFDYSKLVDQTEPKTMGTACKCIFPRVFIVSKDLNPSVNGTRFRLLQAAGKEIIDYLCKQEADFSNRAFFQHQPYITTILQFNPFLTTRLPHGGKNPKQFLFESHFRKSETAYRIDSYKLGGVS